MDNVSDFNRNIAKIDSLKASYYEKDIVRSAYYNHLNNIPISKEALGILKKYAIVFQKGNILINSQENSIEARKRQYRDSLRAKNSNPNTSHAQPTSSVYMRDFIQPSNAGTRQSKTILDIFNQAQILFDDSNKLLAQCKNILNICFKKDELSYSMIANIIAKIETDMSNSMQALSDFLNPFIELFDGLHTEAQKTIFTKAQSLLQKIQTEKDISADLCIKLSSIRAQNTLKKEENFMDYLQSTIKKLDNYLQE